MIGRDEINRMKSERNMVFIALLFASAMILIAVLLVWKGQITGYQALDVLEDETATIAISSPDNYLRFERIPNFAVKSGEEAVFKVRPNVKEVEFSDNTMLFDITPEGIVRFKPARKDIGTHNAIIIITDKEGHYYCQNVRIVIE